MTVEDKDTTGINTKLCQDDPSLFWQVTLEPLLLISHWMNRVYNPKSWSFGFLELGSTSFWSHGWMRNWTLEFEFSATGIDKCSDIELRTEDIKFKCVKP